MKSTGIPWWHFCWCSFATLNVLLSLEELAVKLAGSNVSTKYFQLQLEYRGKREIKVTVCNVPLQLNGDVLAVYLSVYANVEEVMQIRLADGMAHGDYMLNICMDREGFQAVPLILTYKDQQIMMVMEGRWPFCWLGHLARFCPQKTSTNNSYNNNNNYSKNKTIITKPTLEPGDHPNNTGEGWTQVTERRNHHQIQQPKNYYLHEYHQKFQQQKKTAKTINLKRHRQ